MWVLGFAVAGAAAGQFVDDFDRADAPDLGNGWIEKNPAAFSVSAAQAAKLGVGTGYRDNIAYRPAVEDLLDVEASVELRLLANPPGYPQILVRVQSATVAAANVLDGYILYVSNNAGQAVLGRQTGNSFVATLATIGINPALNTADTFRLRLRAEGTNPVDLEAYVERLNGGSWDVIGQAFFSDFAANRIGTAGTVGFGGYVESSYRYDNFGRVDLGAGDNPVPAVTALDPDAVDAGSPGFNLELTGSGFIAGSVVRWEGEDRPTTFVSATRLDATIGAADVADPAAVAVTVFNPAPGGGLSDSATFTVNFPGGTANPTPVATAISPDAATRSGGAVGVTVDGADFTTDSVVRWNGQDLATTFVSASELSVMLSAGDLQAAPGASSITVFTPAPGGGSSQPLLFLVLDDGETYFSDTFNRPDGPNLGNGWVQKTPGTFTLAGGATASADLSLTYHNSIVYRPAIEDRRDVEAGFDFIRTAGNVHFPQLHARVQRDTVEDYFTIESYLFFIDDYAAPPGRAIFAIQAPVPEETECYIEELPLPTALVEGERYRLRFRVEGTSPVVMTGWVDRFDGTTWQTMATASTTHDVNTQRNPALFCDPGFMPPPIVTPGSYGFAKWYDLPDRYDNFYWRDLGELANDTTPPTVTSVFPATGAAGVASDVIVSASFDEVIDAATLTTATFELRDEGGLPVAATVAYDGTATLTPDAPLPSDATFTATITGGPGGVTDLAGNPLTADFSWSFTTTTQTDLQVVDFDSPAPPGNGGDLLNGIFDGIDWGTGQWRWEGPAGPDPSNHVYFDSGTGTSRTFVFPAPRILGSIDVFALTAGTLTLSDDTGQSVTRALNTGPMQTVNTGWIQASSTVTVDYTDGWSLGVDNVEHYSDGPPPEQFALTVVRAGNGPGTVTSSPAGINCGSDCSEVYTSGTEVTLTAAAGGGATFDGWSGPADCADGVVTLTADLTCTATFSYPFTCPCTIWNEGAQPSVPSGSETQAVEVGVRFRTEVDGYITGLRFYKGPSNNGIHTANLWTANGNPLASATFTFETATGWQQVSFGTPVPVTANTTYVASYHAPQGGVSYDQDYFATTGEDSPPLRALADGEDGANGVYRYGPSAFPDSTFFSTNYWVDVVFDTVMPPDTTPPTVVSVSPPDGATEVPRSGTTVEATFNEAMDPASITGATFQLQDGAGAVVATSLSYDQASRTAVLTPTAPLAASTTFTAVILGGGGGVTDAAGNPLAADVTWNFTSSAGLGCPCTIWEPSAVPGTPSANDPNAVEIGVRFRADIDGYILGVRYYRGPQNGGTHRGRLWATSGTLLASATFTNETATGWQQVNFDTAVPITANTTYIASYHAPQGGAAFDQFYFSGSGVARPPLRALADGEDGGNGVYLYGAGGFPTSTWNGSNYWVDVVFSEEMGADSTPPSVISVNPAAGAPRASVNTAVSATFDEAMDQATIGAATFELRDAAGGLLAATVAYDAPTRTAILTPEVTLMGESTHTATVLGGAGGVTDLAGNPLATDYVWSFTTAPRLDQGTGGPILVVKANGLSLGGYYAEILRAEGLNAFTVRDLGEVDAGVLAGYDLVILAETVLSAADVTMFSDWVAAGGKLIALRPDPQLAGLLGLTAEGATLTDAYLMIDTSAGSPGEGLVGQTIQYHGTADLYSLDGAAALATLYSDASTATAYPAVTLTSVGANGGQAAAFAYDLARSVVYTRQGNPAWNGLERDGVLPIRPFDLFYGNAAQDPQPDWVDFTRIAIPQADEQQRLLANLILEMTWDRTPLPRFWYFPRGERAVVILTGDDHGNGGTAGRFNLELNNASPPGCSVEDWECVRSTSYIYESTPITDAEIAAYQADGFEIALHVDTGCLDWTPASLDNNYFVQLSGLQTAFPSIAPPATNRTHCIVWSDWATQPQIQLDYGIRLDTSYYYWLPAPPAINDYPGLFTGSGMPMRFADLDGQMIDVYQATTQMHDEGQQSYPQTIDTLLDRALGVEGYYGAFTVNMHTDWAYQAGWEAIVLSAQARGVPLVSSRQMLDWLDGRNEATFGGLTWDGFTLGFTVTSGPGANGLQALLPTTTAFGSLGAINRDGNAVAYSVETIKGIEYAIFDAEPGFYQATY